MWNSQKKIYYVAYMTTAMWLPESRHFIFAKKLRAFWAKKIVNKMGKNVNVERNAKFSPDLIIGNNSGLGIRCEINGKVTIGDNVMMGPECVIYTINHEHKSGTVYGESGYENEKPVKIGNNCWIGRRVMFMPGSEIGDNCVVAAGAVITKKFPSNVIVGGVPAKILKEN